MTICYFLVPALDKSLFLFHPYVILYLETCAMSGRISPLCVPSFLWTPMLPPSGHDVSIWLPPLKQPS